MEPGSMKTVQVVPETMGEFQRLYLDPEGCCLRPNLVFVSRHGTIYFETNEIGLKGDPLDPRRELAVIWGDSVAFGIGVGWTPLLDNYFPNYQFLNGGIEANTYLQVLQRCVKFNQEYHIALNIILLGWHSFAEGNKNVRDALIDKLPKIHNPVLVTMPTALNRNLLTEDLTPLFTGGDANVGFYFHGTSEYSISMQTRVFDYICERNQIVREVATENRLPLIDLFSFFSTAGLEDFRHDFFDVLHPRPSAYPKLAQAIADGISPLIESEWEYRWVDASPTARRRSWLAGLAKVLGRRTAKMRSD